MTALRLLLAGALVFAGCQAVHDVAVTSFHVIDAPAKFVRDRLDQDQTTTTTTTTTVSDVSTPGAPVTQPTPRVVRREATTHHAPAETTRRREVATSSSRKVSASPTPSPHPSSATTTQFPTAKPVPGKPGYVYSIDPKGGIIDVTGYKSGDKAKDPYTKQIFIVP